MFVVMYNFTDMPANSQTFLRQRTLSGRPSLQASQVPMCAILQVLFTQFFSTENSSGTTLFDSLEVRMVLKMEYVIWSFVRFRCSKSGHIYLHTDVRMIFARRAPDIDHDPNNVSLYSVTEGPTQPHYTPITSRS